MFATSVDNENLLSCCKINGVACRSEVVVPKQILFRSRFEKHHVFYYSQKTKTKLAPTK
jgi:hypothetical protein